MAMTRLAAVICLVLAACSGAPEPVKSASQPLQPELKPPEKDLEFEAAQALLAAGPVDKYVPLKWINIARQALDSDGAPADLRGDFPRALRWAGLAAQAARPSADSELTFEVLSEHVRICNHTGQPSHAVESLKRLRSFARLDPIQKSYIDVMEFHAKVLKTRLADGTYSLRYWSFVTPSLANEMAALGAQLDRLLAPNQSNQALQDAWLRLHVIWATIVTDLATGKARANERVSSPGWVDGFGALEKDILRTIWFIPSEGYPKVVSVLHLTLNRFYASAGEPDKAAQNLKTARVRVLPGADVSALLRVDLAEIDHILAPDGNVETMGINVGGPTATDSTVDPLPTIHPPAPESVWQERASQVEGTLFTAETRYRNAKNLRGLAATWLRRGYLASGLGQYDEAAEFYRQSESVASLAGDSAAAIIALGHLMALELYAGQIGRAHQAATRFFAQVDNSGYQAMALSIADMLVGFAAREFSAYGGPTQRLTTLKLVESIYRRYAPPPLQLRVLASLLRLAAHYRYVEEVRSYAAQGLALAAQIKQNAPASATAIAGAECTIVRLAATALAVRPDCDRRCLKLAEAALQCAPDAAGPGSELRLTAALARASNNQADGARELLGQDDLDGQLAVARRAGESQRIVEISQQLVAISRQNLAALLPPPEPVAEGDASDPLADVDSPPPTVDSPAVVAAKANLAVDVMRLAQSLSDFGLERLRAGATRPVPEFAQARTLLDEWRELTMASGEWSQRPWELLGLYGQVAAQQGEKLAAWLSFSGALDALWQSRNAIGSLSGRADFTRQVSAILEDAQRFLLQYPEEAFDVPRLGSLPGAEAALAIHLDLAAHALAARLAGGTPFQGKLIAGQDGVALEALEDRLRKAQSEEAYRLVHSSNEQAMQARKERETVAVWLEQSRLDLARKYPRLGLALGAPNPPTPAALRELARKRNLTFVIYGLSHPQSTVWIVSGETIHAVTIPASRREIAELVERIRAVLEQGKEPASSLTRLTGWLVSPIAQYLPAAGTLAMVPQGPLQTFPLGILGPDGQPLLADHPMLMVPSVELFAALAQSDAGPRRDVKMLLMQDPGGTAAYSSDDRRQRSVTQTLPPLAGRLEQLLDDDERVTTYSGAKATETAFYGAWRGRDILHLAAPLSPFVAEPMYSGLELAKDDSGDEDGLLQAWELAATPLNARLAVLHLQGTTSDAWSAAQATAGISRGLFAAGVSAILANTVATDESASQAYLAAFYAQLATGARVCDAARNASLTLRASPDFTHASKWAAFAVYGLGDSVVMATQK